METIDIFTTILCVLLFYDNVRLRRGLRQIADIVNDIEIELNKKKTNV